MAKKHHPGETPRITINLKDNGAAYDCTGWTTYKWSMKKPDGTLVEILPPTAAFEGLESNGEAYLIWDPTWDVVNDAPVEYSFHVYVEKSATDKFYTDEAYFHKLYPLHYKG